MLTPSPRTPAQSLDLAFRRQKPTRAQLTDFLAARAALLATINPAESEEHLKTLLRDFLAHPGVLGAGHYLNVAGRRDLVARTGPREADPVGLLLEVKKAANPTEMVTPHDLNRKALHELLLYYMQDREDKSGADLRRLVITNGYEWFVFDNDDFDLLFWRNTSLKKEFQAWAAGQKAGKTTDYFYREIAAPALAALDGTLPFTHLDLRQLPTAETAQVAWLKLFQPAHLLKLPFAQDANTLNRAFYEELLYLIGLEEIKDKGRKLIRRCAEARRQPGSLLENTLDALLSEDQLANLLPAELAALGPTPAAQAEALALELGLTWINRLLFLKLLEGQLRRYHQHPANPAALTEKFRFLTPALLPEYDTLNKLFFAVLNTPPALRRPEISAHYGHLPYLNSSLYEPAEYERRTVRIGNLEDHRPLPLHPKSVLRAGAKADAAPPEALAYLLRFLDAYDFASEGEEQVQETQKSLISAAVLGLIFEKLNGYQDGSFYTPGFVTMYMARHSLRRAVLAHFERRYGWGAATVPELADALDGKKRPEYSTHFNALTVVDPAVGSGHFLVSALNELLAIKAELGLLLDDEGRRLRYRLTVARDELVVQHDDDESLVQYQARLDPLSGQRTVPAEHHRLQSALFREKRHLMEHALFGVDLNPNSVRICRLRLWIELLKHAYYRPEGGFAHLETLPNLDLNIKTGNSLLARFPLSENLADVFRQGRFTLATYRDAVSAYFNTRDRAEKQKLLDFLRQIKAQFTQTLHLRDKRRQALFLAKGQRTVLETQGQLLPETPQQQADREMDILGLARRIEKMEADIDAHEQGALFRHAFEWRFEFPEVLNNDGSFRGFDVVIGNPPYLTGGDAKTLAKIFREKYFIAQYQLDLYTLFIERSHELLATEGQLALITPNSWLKNTMMSKTREFIDKSFTIGIIAPNISAAFKEASVDTLVIVAQKAAAVPNETIEIVSLNESGAITKHSSAQGRFALNDNYIFDVESDNEISPVLAKIKAAGKPLESFCDISFGFRAYDAYVGHSAETISSRAFHADSATDETFVPYIHSKDIGPFKHKWNGKTFIRFGEWLAAPRADKYYQGKRIVMREIIGPTFVATLLQDDLKVDRTLYIAKPKPDCNLEAEFILGVLSSRILTNYFRYANNEFDALFPKIRLKEFAQLPIPAAPPATQAAIAALVTQVLEAKAAGQPTAALEAEIDAAVAACYGLLPAEATALGA